MERNMIVWIFSALLFIAAGCGTGSTPGNNATQNKVTEQVTYTCPMHAQIKSSNPGDCPICGMKLVKAENKADTTDVNKKDTV